MCCLLLAGVCLVASLIGYSIQYGYWRRRGVAGPRAVPLFGNLLEFVMARKHFGDVYGEIYRKYSNAKYVGVYKMSTPSLLLRDLDLIHNVLSRNHASFERNDFFVNEQLDPLVSKNPFVMVGQEWRQARGLISPMLTIAKVKAMFPTMQHTCDKLRFYVASCVVKEFEAKELFYKYAVENFAALAFGWDAGTFDDPQSEFLLCAMAIFQPNWLKNLAILFFPSLLQPLAVRFVPSSVDKWLRSIVSQVMKQRRRQTNAAPRNDFLQAIISHTRSEEELDEDTIVGNCLMFLSEGTELSAITLTYTFYELARNAEVQQKLFEEVSSCGDMLTADALANMRYLEQVIYETLRMHSTVKTLTKICQHPVEIDGQYEDSQEKLMVEAGTKIIIPVHEIHMDPKYFPDPKSFNPSRFAKENRETLSKMAFLAFGEGPRLCVGKLFGMFQVKAAIASILSKYRVELSEKMTEEPTQSPTAFTLHCDTGIWIKLIPRK